MRANLGIVGGGILGLAFFCVVTFFSGEGLGQNPSRSDHTAAGIVSGRVPGGRENREEFQGVGFKVLPDVGDRNACRITFPTLKKVVVVASAERSGYATSVSYVNANTVEIVTSIRAGRANLLTKSTAVPFSFIAHQQ